MQFLVPDDLDLLPLTLTFKLVRARDQTRLPCEFGATQIRSAVPGIFHTRTKSHGQRQKQNFTQFTACGKNVGSRWGTCPSAPQLATPVSTAVVPATSLPVS